jgi:hypothetical protein
MAAQDNRNGRVHTPARSPAVYGSLPATDSDNESSVEPEFGHGDHGLASASHCQ